MRKLKIILEMIKFEHTIFALPFAVMSAFIAADGFPPLPKLGWILVAMVGARSCAMAFNRLADAEIDGINPRTAMRAIPAGLITKGAVWSFTIVSAGLLVFAAWRLNPLAFVTLSGRTCCGYGIFLYQTFHRTLSLLVGTRALHLTRRCVDRNSGQLCANADCSLSRRAALDSRVRHHLCLSRCEL